MEADFDWALVKQGDKREREKAIDRYLYLASAVGYKVARSLPGHIEKDDIIQLACLGLCRAVDNYKPEMGVKFETYCVPVIRGAIYDELRQLDWAPRSLRKKQRDINDARAIVESEHQRAATDQEILDVVQAKGEPTSLTSTRDIARTRLQTKYSVVHSLDEIAPWDDEEAHAHIGAMDAGTTPVLSLLVGELVEWLKTRTAVEQAVVALYYYEGMKLADIGKVLGTSEGKVSSVHKVVALEIRQFMGERLRDG